MLVENVNFVSWLNDGYYTCNQLTLIHKPVENTLSE